jgi:hypothetical protein
MAKAILTRINIEQRPLDHDYAMAFGGIRRNYPMSFEYHLSYVSYEPIDISVFPAEIDTENVTRDLIISPTMANPDCTIERTYANAKTHKKLIRVVNNSIGQLEVEE